MASPSSLVALPSLIEFNSQNLLHSISVNQQPISALQTKTASPSTFVTLPSLRYIENSHNHFKIQSSSLEPTKNQNPFSAFRIKTAAPSNFVTLPSLIEYPENPQNHYEIQTASPSSCKRHEFLIALAIDFSRYGAPAHRLEHRLASVSSAVGLGGTFFFVLPGVILISFPLETKHSTTNMVKSPVPCHDLAKLSAVNYLCREVDEAKVSVGDAWTRLYEISTLYYDVTSLRSGLSSKPTNVWISTLLIFFTISFTLSLILFNSTWIESLLAGVMGLIAHLYMHGGNRHSFMGPLVEGK
jgi:uncharacterized membrane protein YjjP (DUF1212 family)